MLGCRVLVTVPACLEILMLSPRNRPWVASLKYVIFDEIHCMNEVWEMVTALIRQRSLVVDSSNAGLFTASR